MGSKTHPSAVFRADPRYKCAGWCAARRNEFVTSPPPPSPAISFPLVPRNARSARRPSIGHRSNTFSMRDEKTRDKRGRLILYPKSSAFEASVKVGRSSLIWRLFRAFDRGLPSASSFRSSVKECEFVSGGDTPRRG